MDEKAPFTWLLTELRSSVASLTASYASALTNAITPIVALCFGIYMIFIVLNYWRGSETNPVTDFFTRVVSWAAVIGLGLNSENYNSRVLPMVTGLGEDLSNLLTGGNVNAQSLDQLALYYLGILDKGFEAAAGIGGVEGLMVTVMVALKFLIIWLSLMPFLVAAAIAILTADVGAQILGMLGPLYFAFLLFPATRAWFSAWLNAVKSHAIIPVIVAAISTMSVSLSVKMLSVDGTLADASFTRVFMAGMGNILLVLLLYRVSMIAQSLSAGGLNLTMAGGVGRAAASMRDSINRSGREVKGASNAYGAWKQRRADKANKSNQIKKLG